MSCHYVPIFHIEQFGSIHLEFAFSFIPWFSELAFFF